MVEIKDIDFDNLDVILELLCPEYPESYHLYIQEKLLGYLKIRDGLYVVEYLPSKDTVFTSFTLGYGYFVDSERDYFLKKGIKEIILHHLSYINEEKDKSKEDLSFIKYSIQEP